MFNDLPTIYKAVAAGIVTAVAAELARYGFQTSPETVTALGVIVTAVVAYAGGHLVVYFAPKNKEKI